MYAVLIVDDEQYAVDGIVEAVDWQQLNVTRVFKAISAGKAKEVLSNHHVDVMICDIEMPGEDGLSLMKWAKTRDSSIKGLFLTCHEEFGYAQEAIKLGSRDYLLKPVNYQELTEVVRKTLRETQEERETADHLIQYEKSRYFWENKQAILLDRFWQDIINRRIAPTLEHVKRSMEEFTVDLDPGARVTPILISIERWLKELSEYDEELLRYAMMNAAKDLLYPSSKGHVFQDRDGAILALLYSEGSVISVNALRTNGELYVKACLDYFYCQVSCYVGPSSFIYELPQTYSLLLETERTNVSVSNRVLFAMQPSDRHYPVRYPSFFEWSDFLERGMKAQLNEQINLYFKQMSKEQSLVPEMLDAFYHGLLQTVYYVLHKHRVPIQALSDDERGLHQSTATRSFSQLQDWARDLLEKVFRLLESTEREEPAVDKVKRIIADSIPEELTREELADQVHLNPAYLSRLFKKETGLTITDYIIKEKMELARYMLTSSNDTISAVARKLNYSNFSYFSRLFRKHYDMSPQDYRTSLKDRQDQSL